MRTSLFALSILLLLLAPLGCQNEDAELKEEVLEETGGGVDTSMTQIMDEPAEPEVEIGHTATAVIDETTIGIEEILEPVQTVFTIRNSGLTEHSFALSGPNGTWQLENFLEPGETGTLEVPLEPGTYRVYDPLDETISIEVVVEEPAPVTQE
ncbi:MAG: hypothetical protein R3338_02085 [Thermoanaerobaculia bacterium]|nr:hypothetical protein [Thermoanaerobaculia bacterium]